MLLFSGHCVYPLMSMLQVIGALWARGIMQSELSGPQGAIAARNTPGPKCVACLMKASLLAFDG